MNIELELTDIIPEDIQEGILYVSLKHWITAHKCVCGCGNKVVLRLSPRHWAITLNGESVSLYPSVGNWQLPCRSHYWIEEGRILQARDWSDEEVAWNRSLTKGVRTPNQTPYSRFEKTNQFDPSSDLEVKGSATHQRNDLEERVEEYDGGCPESQPKSESEIKNGLYNQWWKNTRNTIGKKWRTILDRVGIKHVA